MSNASLAIQVLPLDAGSKQGVIEAVDRAIAIISESGMEYEVGPFETTIEGEVGLLWDVAYKAHRAVKDSGVKSVLTYIKLSESDDPLSTEEKVAKHRDKK